MIVRISCFSTTLRALIFLNHKDDLVCLCAFLSQEDSRGVGLDPSETRVIERCMAGPVQQQRNSQVSYWIRSTPVSLKGIVLGVLTPVASPSVDSYPAEDCVKQMIMRAHDACHVQPVYWGLFEFCGKANTVLDPRRIPSSRYASSCTLPLASIMRSA